LAPAKVNLFLEVTGRRRDGFHRLRTVFAKVGLADRVEVEVVPEPIGIDLRLDNRTGFAIPAGPENLAYRAARLYLDRSRSRAGVRIRLIKRIPPGAGLGGGSSDAGAVLKALHRLLPAPGGRPGLVRIARELGADVPVFVLDGSIFVAGGIGDRPRPLRVPTPRGRLVLVFPGVTVLTVEAYRSLQLPRREEVLTSLGHLDKLIQALARGLGPSGWGPFLFNRLEQAVVPIHPAVARARQALLSLGVPAALLSGSGSCVFAPVRGPSDGRRLLPRLRRYGWRVWLVRFLD